MDRTYPIDLDSLCASKQDTARAAHCNGCTNQCALTVFSFPGGRKYFIGNQCERIFSNHGADRKRGTNLFTQRNELVFKRSLSAVPAGRHMRIGIPRILGMFELFPFWNALLTGCGFEVVLSAVSDQPLYEKGVRSVMSDNICFPAKLAHGHIANLIEAKVDRIFYPHVVHNFREDETAVNSYNCPIVSAYGEVLRGSMGLGTNGVPPLDSPAISFRNDELLKKACSHYLKLLGVSKLQFRHAFAAALSAQKEYRSALLREGEKLIEQARDRKLPLIVLAGRPYHADPFIEHRTSEMLSDFGVEVIPADVVAEMIDARWNDLMTVSQWSYPNRVLKAAQWVAAQPDLRIQLVMITSFGCGPDAFITDEIRSILAASGKIFTLIKVDDISSTGAVRLRLRSLLETIRWRPSGRSIPCLQSAPAPVYTAKDRGKIMIVPYFADCYSPYLFSVFKSLGYDLRILPPPDAQSVEYGMQHTDNEVCYPAIIIVGDIVKAFACGGYDPHNTVVLLPQTGGQCRASSYVSLVKRALVKAGYLDVPVAPISSRALRIQGLPGVKVNMRQAFKLAAYSLFYADAIARMYYRCSPRERDPGGAMALRDRYLKAGTSCIERSDPNALLPLLEEAVVAFDDSIIDCGPRPQIAVVGEIYLKYNAFGQMHIIDWMISQHVEVTVPPLADFFLQYFVNARENRKLYLLRFTPLSLLEGAAERWIGRWNREFEIILEQFRLYEPPVNIHRKAAFASEIVSLVNQYGEGWLIPAEIASLAARNIQNIVCVQPFGCIANHVVAKGIECTIKQRYPLINLLFLDFDAGTTEVNVLNRLHFMIDNLKAAGSTTPHTPPQREPTTPIDAPEAAAYAAQ